MTKLRELWDKMKYFLAAAGGIVLTILLMFIKKSDKAGETALRDEMKLREDTNAKLEKEKKRIEDEKQKQLQKLEKEEAARLVKVQIDVDLEKKKLLELESADKEGFKKVMEQQLGVKEKK